jgi:hypothetical protein
MEKATIPGYRMGDPAFPPSTLDDAALARLCEALLLTDDDREALREAKAIVEPHIEELLDVWYGFVGSHDFLLRYFSTAEGPHHEYLARVRARFGQWVRDVLSADFGPAWRAYQAEVGRRHAGSKNQTDGVVGAPPVVHFRYMVALVAPIVLTMRPFLARGARDAKHLERMHDAWLKGVLLSLSLWSEAYVRDGWY